MVFEAATQGDLERLQATLDDDPQQIKAYDAEGWTALHLAGHYGHTDAVQMLLDRGADVAAVSRNGIANQSLHAALAGRADADIVQLLLDAGADVNGLGGSGIRPLHVAAARGSAELVRLLLERGADPRARMDDGQLPADLARGRGHPEVAEQLTRAEGASGR